MISRGPDGRPRCHSADATGKSQTWMMPSNPPVARARPSAEGQSVDSAVFDAIRVDFT